VPTTRTLPRGWMERRWVAICQRVLLAVVGGYFLSAALVAWGALALASVMPRSEAVVLMGMLGFVVYLGVLLWAFAEPRLGRLWVVLAGVPLAAAGLRWLLPAAGVRMVAGG